MRHVVSVRLSLTYRPVSLREKREGLASVSDVECLWPLPSTARRISPCGKCVAQNGQTAGLLAVGWLASATQHAYTTSGGGGSGSSTWKSRVRRTRERHDGRLSTGGTHWLHECVPVSAWYSKSQTVPHGTTRHDRRHCKVGARAHVTASSTSDVTGVYTDIDKGLACTFRPYTAAIVTTERGRGVKRGFGFNVAGGIITPTKFYARRPEKASITMLLLRASIVIVAVVLSSHADACSMPVGWRPLSAVERLLNAREVLFATVLRTFPDHGFGYGAGRTTAYTAEVDVHCILKGHRSDSIINITRAGE